MDRCGIRFGRSDNQVFKRQLQLFDLALDLFRRVADILAFSACKAAIIAFSAAGSSGRFWAPLDMRLTTTGHAKML